MIPDARFVALMDDKTIRFWGKYSPQITNDHTKLQPEKVIHAVNERERFVMMDVLVVVLWHTFHEQDRREHNFLVQDVILNFSRRNTGCNIEKEGYFCPSCHLKNDVSPAAALPPIFTNEMKGARRLW